MKLDYVYKVEVVSTIDTILRTITDNSTYHVHAESEADAVSYIKKLHIDAGYSIKSIKSKLITVLNIKGDT